LSIVHSPPARVQKSPLPCPEIFDKWLCNTFSENSKKRIYILDGSGETWKKQKPRSVIVTACHADINTVQLKTFHRMLLLRQIAVEYSVEPIVYIMALGDIARGVDPEGIKEKVAQTRKFIRETFSPLNVKTIVDHTNMRICSIFTVLDFDKSLERILNQMKTPEELERTQFFGEKRTALTQTEKRLLRIYLFERKMLEAESKKYPYIGWGLEAQAELGASYNIYDESNAGAAVLRKLVSIDNGREYPGTIVLPDPLTIGGSPMRYQVQQSDLRTDDTLLISDSFAEVKHKLVDQKDVSNEYLDFLIRSIVEPFAPKAVKKEKSLLASPKTNALYDEKKRSVFKHYWIFIKPYYCSIERITGLHEGLFIHENLVEEALNALGSKRNRIILQEIANYYQSHRDGMTTRELSQQMGLVKSQRRSLNRNLHQLEECGLVTSVREDNHVGKYYVYGNKTLIQIRWSLLRTAVNSADD
jgi:DNA-binding HxlR family transcriptional regulator